MSQSRIFIQKMFRKYYEEHSSLVKAPSEIEKREFGFTLFKEGMLRHKSFQNIEALASFLSISAPLDAYFSCAYYENPEAEMEKKDWSGADLIFDIDADHIPTPCDKVHDEWICDNCKFVGKGVAPKNCPACGGEKFYTNTWPCEVCLSSAKVETVKLLDMLSQDFGFSKKEMRVFFSGHRGYHVHIEDGTINMFDSIARREIVDYVSALGFDTIFNKGNKKAWKRAYDPSRLSLYNLGWHARIAKGLHDFIFYAKEEDLVGIGLKKSVIKTILENKESILGDLSDSGNLIAVKGLGFETWRRIAEFCIQKQSAKIDTVVTTDVHRLIRMADTLHSKTGLKKVEFPISSIEDFDPFESARAFKKGTETIFVYDAPKFRLGDMMYGPYKNRKVELPTAVAMLLVCKRRAEIVE